MENGRFFFVPGGDSDNESLQQYYLHTDTQQLFFFFFHYYNSRKNAHKPKSLSSQVGMRSTLIGHIDSSSTFKNYFSSFGRTISSFWIAEVKIPGK